MGRIRKPIVFSTHFGIDSTHLDRLGVLNPVLNVDTKLFIDPLLIRKSKHVRISHDGAENFTHYFEMIIKLLKASKSSGDVAWRQAAARLEFIEIKWTCLGYGSSSIRGRKSAQAITARLVQTAKEIVDLGIEDPDLFSLLPLLEDGVGPDLISDLTTKAILPSLAVFTEDICKELGIATTIFPIDDRKYQLPVNPTERHKAPVLLVPKDVLRSLPLASDWSEVADAAAANAAIRSRVNRLIGNIWEAKTRKEKAKLRSNALASKDSFETLLEMVKTAKVNPYDLKRDPEGLLVWHTVHERIAQDYPLLLELKGRPTFESAVNIVETIIEQFRSLVEEKGHWKLLWHGTKPHREKVSQMVFFAVADAYCKANNLEITPEADTGAGPVDFKFSASYDIRLLVEVKLSSNPTLIAGYTKQLEAYKIAEKAVHATYLVIDIGHLGNKGQKLLDIKNKWSASSPVSNLAFIDGKQKLSASKRT